jgi:hypothetical protein
LATCPNQNSPTDSADEAYSGDERYPLGGGIEAIGLTAMADALARLEPTPSTST